MIDTVPDVYESRVTSSGKLELRAKALLAEGTEKSVFDACVLLHEAARLQRLALSALSACPPATVLSSRVEQCWCYIEGRDPTRAAQSWGDVLLARDGVPPQAADAIMSRIVQRFEDCKRELAGAYRSAPALQALHRARDFAALSPQLRAGARRDLAGFVKTFPGASSFWWMSYRLAEGDADKSAAWDALARARRLDPDNPRFEAMAVLVATWALPPAEAKRHVGAVAASVRDAAPEVCLMYALAEVSLARKASRAERTTRWSKARDAACLGIATATSAGLHSNLRAVQLLLDELLAGRAPTTDILFRAGFAEQDAMVDPNMDVIDFMTSRLRRTDPALEQDRAG